MISSATQHAVMGNQVALKVLPKAGSLCQNFKGDGIVMTIWVQAVESCTVASVAARRPIWRGTAQDTARPQKLTAMFKTKAHARPRKLAVQPAVVRRSRSMRRIELVARASSSDLAAVGSAVPWSSRDTAA